MIADGTIPPKFTLGIATEDIINGDDGFVTEFGLVRGIDATGTPYGETWNDGDLLYFDPSTAGSWTNVKPTSPSISIPVAIVLYATSGTSGSIFVRMGRQSCLSDLCDVAISSISDGDLLQYSSANSRWENVSGASGSFTTTDGKTVTVINGIVTSIV